MVEVTQADRERAKTLLGRDGAGPSWWSIDSSNADNDPMVQAFARHREAAVAEKDAEIARLRELEAELTANEQEVSRLQIALARYGDWVAMANAPAELQQTIDTALATATALKMVPARAVLSNPASDG